MALPKKTSRKIVVNGRNYRWATSCSGDLNPSWRDSGLALTLIVELEGEINPRIYDRISLPELPGIVWQIDQDDSFVHPRHVAAVVDAAIADGWSPDARINYDSSVLYDLVVSEFSPHVAKQLKSLDHGNQASGPQHRAT